MLNFIKNNLELLKFMRRPLKIRSYTDVKREGCLESMVGLRSKMYNMNLSDIDNGIILIGFMEIDAKVQPILFDVFQDIKNLFYMMQSNYGYNPYFGCFR